jgi:integrating conjugative element protein (TIGR03758 family)
MSFTAAQATAFQASAGFTAGEVSAVALAIVFAVLLLYGAWAIRTAYAGWATNDLSNAQVVLMIARFLAMFLALGFFLL